jgi:hypothetical protein
MDRIRARGMADLSIREAASRTIKVPEGSKGGFFDQHEKYLRGQPTSLNRVASTAIRTFDMGVKPGNGTRAVDVDQRRRNSDPGQAYDNALSEQITPLYEPGGQRTEE